SGDIAAARSAVAQIVGRDPATLDDAGIARATIESLAENASAGIVAPLFWGALFGLPGILGYKAINTLDSMIGHRSERHEAFGWAAARIDDLANLIPARLTGLLFVLLAPNRAQAWSCMLRDAHRH
ncbi:cobalamin biosynthesis protein CobD, partial [Listeria monocytogenes]